MKEEVQRISKLVAEGKLSPEDAADLIDAFYASERPSEPVAPPVDPTYTGSVPPPPPPPPAPPYDSFREPLRGFLDSVEKLTKEASESVNWQEVASQAKEGAKKSMESLRAGLEDLSKGKVNFSWISNHETKEVRLPLQVSSGQIVRIENPNGNVKVLGGFEVGSATAHATFLAATTEEAKEKARDYVFIVEESDHVISIRQPNISGLSVDLVVELPTSVSVEIRSSSGDVEVTDTNAGARVYSHSGDVKLRGLFGPVEVSADSGDIDITDAVSTSLTIESKSGDVALKRINGNINAKTASGDFSVIESAGKIVTLETVSGDVYLDLVQPVSGNVSVRTVNGDAYVAVPDGSDCRVSLSTLRGDVNTNIQLADEAKAEMRVTGKLGMGTGTLDVSAVTGDIHLELRGSTVTA